MNTRPLLPEHLAARFGAMLLDAVGVDTYAEICRRNASDGISATECASHDYCDANMVMSAAMASFGIPERAVFRSERHRILWNAAWDAWKRDAACKR